MGVQTQGYYSSNGMTKHVGDFRANANDDGDDSAGGNDDTSTGAIISIAAAAAAAAVMVGLLVWRRRGSTDDSRFPCNGGAATGAAGKVAKRRRSSGIGEVGGGRVRTASELVGRVSRAVSLERGLRTPSVEENTLINDDGQASEAE